MDFTVAGPCDASKPTSVLARTAQTCRPAVAPVPHCSFPRPAIHASCSIFGGSKSAVRTYRPLVRNSPMAAVR